MLKRISGAPKVEWYPKTASTPIKNGNAVISTSGYLVNGSATATTFVGVIQRDTVSTDADYATTAKVPVDVALSDAIFEADVKFGVSTAATLLNTLCDGYIGVGSNPTNDVLYEMYVDTGTNTHHQFVIVGIVNGAAGGKVLVRINQAATLRSQAVA